LKVEEEEKKQELRLRYDPEELDGSDCEDGAPAAVDCIKEKIEKMNENLSRLE